MALVDPTVELATPAGRRRWLVRVIVGALVGLVVVAVVVATAGGLAKAYDALRGMSLGWVTVAVGAAALRIGLYGVQISVLARPSGELTPWTAIRLSLVVFGVGAVTPAAPAEGLALAGYSLQRRGRDRQTAVLTLGLVEWFTQRSFYAVGALNLLIVVVIGHLTAAESWPFTIGAMGVIVVLVTSAVVVRYPTSAAAAAVVLGALRFRRSDVPREVRRENGRQWHASAMAIIGTPGNRLRLVALSVGAVLADAGVLWAACVAAGIDLAPELVVLAATVGTMASWVPLLPAGIGVVEAVMPSILHHFGAPLGVALAATVVYRAAGVLLPALVGLGAAPSLRRTEPAQSAGAECLGAVEL